MVSLTVPLELSPLQTEPVSPLCLPTFASPAIIACCPEGSVRIDRNLGGINMPGTLQIFNKFSLYSSIPIFVLSLENLSLYIDSEGFSTSLAKPCLTEAALYVGTCMCTFTCACPCFVCVCPCTCLWRPEDYLEHHSLNAVM